MMRKNVAKIIAVVFLACVFLLPNVSLAEKSDVSIDQSIFNLDVSAGASSVFKFKIKNDSAQSQQMTIKSLDYAVGDNDQISLLEDADNTNGIKQWISLSEQEFVLEAGQEKEISATLNVPADAAIGSHWGGIFVQFSSVNEDGDFTGPLVNGQIGVHVLANVAGEINGSGEIKLFSVPKFLSHKADFQMEYENTGNIHYIPHGEISVKNIFSGRSEKIILDKHFVFPHKKFTYTAQWNNVFSLSGIYAVQVNFVDGVGSVHTQTKYMFGILFFPLLMLLVIMLFVFAIFFKKIRSRK